MYLNPAEPFDGLPVISGCSLTYQHKTASEHLLCVHQLCIGIKSLQNCSVIDVSLRQSRFIPAECASGLAVNTKPCRRKQRQQRFHSTPLTERRKHNRREASPALRSSSMQGASQHFRCCADHRAKQLLCKGVRRRS